MHKTLIATCGFCMILSVPLSAARDIAPSPLMDAITAPAEVSVSTGPTGTQEAEQQPLDQPVLMKDLLAALPKEDRDEFVGGLLINDGRVLSSCVVPLERTLSDDGVEKILKLLYAKSTWQSSGKSKQLVPVAELLKDVPEKVRYGFTDNMMYWNGRIVSVYARDLRKVLGEDKTEKIIQSLFPFADDTAPCVNGVCLNTICGVKKTGDGKTSYTGIPKSGWACASVCKQ